MKIIGINFKQLQSDYSQSECSGNSEERLWKVRRRRWIRYRLFSPSTSDQSNSTKSTDGSFSILHHGLLGIRIKLPSRRYDWKTRQFFLLSQEPLSFLSGARNHGLSVGLPSGQGRPKFHSKESGSSQQHGESGLPSKDATPLSPTGISSSKAPSLSNDTIGKRNSIHNQKYSSGTKGVNQHDYLSDDDDDMHADGFEGIHDDDNIDDLATDDDDDEPPLTSESIGINASSSSQSSESYLTGQPVLVYLKNAQIVPPTSISLLSRNQVRIIKLGRNCDVEDLRSSEKGAHSGFFALRVWSRLSKTKYVLNAHNTKDKEVWVKHVSKAISKGSSTPMTPNALPGSLPSKPSRLLPNLRLSSTSSQTFNSTSVAEEAAAAARLRKRVFDGIKSFSSWSVYNNSSNSSTPNSASGLNAKKKSFVATTILSTVKTGSTLTESQMNDSIANAQSSQSMNTKAQRERLSSDDGNDPSLSPQFTKSPASPGKRVWGSMAPPIIGSPISGDGKEKKTLYERRRKSQSVTSDEDDLDLNTMGSPLRKRGLSPVQKEERSGSITPQKTTISRQSSSSSGKSVNALAGKQFKVRFKRKAKGIGIEVRESNGEVMVHRIVSGEDGPVYVNESEAVFFPNDILVSVNGVPISTIKKLKDEIMNMREGFEYCAIVCRSIASDHAPILDPIKSSSASSYEQISPQKKLSPKRSDLILAIPYEEGNSSSIIYLPNNSPDRIHGIGLPPSNSLGITKLRVRESLLNSVQDLILMGKPSHEIVTYNTIMAHIVKQNPFAASEEEFSTPVWRRYFRDVLDEIVSDPKSGYKVQGLQRLPAKDPLSQIFDISPIVVPCR